MTKDRKKNEFSWKGYCIECCKWRHSRHTIQHLESGELRCRICITRLLIICSVCNGGGIITHKEGKESCAECGGHRVIPQQPVGRVK